MHAGSATLPTPRGAGVAAARVSLGPLHGASPQMNRVYRYIEKVAATDSVVLITGEGGTGKELVARTIHRLGARRARPFIPVDCGASAAGAGFEAAAGGTVFLDEIGLLAPELQARLLHVLEKGKASVRVIAATQRNLEEAVRAGAFRRDLLYRLAVFPLHLPALRERAGDAELLARRFVDEINEREHARKTLSRRSLEVIRAHPWPGNVRELRNAIQRAWILAERQLELSPAGLKPRSQVRRAGDALTFPVGTSLDDMRRDMLLATLEQLAGDKRRTAEVLGISLKTLYNRLELYGDVHYVRRRRSAS